jgi:PAS domain S-box-containing protein
MKKSPPLNYPSMSGRMLVLAASGLFFLAILGANIFNHRGEQIFYTQLLRSNAWIAWQLEREYHRFSRSLLAYGIGVGDVDHDQLMLRFEVLLSRIPVVSAGAESEMLRNFVGDVEVAEELNQHLLQIEAQIEALDAGDRAGAEEFFIRIRGFEDRLIKLSTRATLGPESGQIRARLGEAQTRNFWLIIALAASAVVLIGQLIFESIIGRQAASRERGHRERLLRVVSENRRLSDRIASFVSVAPVGFYALESNEGTLGDIYASDSCQLLTGFPLRELLSIRSVVARIPRQDRRNVIAAIRALSRKGEVQLEHRFIRADGVTVWLSHSLRHVVESDGSTELVGVIADINERKTADIALQQGSKLMMLGEMATGLAHELNQPLSVIRMAAQNAITSLNSENAPERVLAKLERINNQTIRAARMIDQMRIFGRPPSSEQEIFSLKQAVLGAVDLVVDQLANAGIQIAAPEIDESVYIIGIQQQLEQAIVNIILNARDAFRDRRGRQPARREDVVRIECRAGAGPGMICIALSDNAGGIAASIIDKLFNPFVTTKKAGEGTGLGLWLTFGFIAKMGGMVTATNIPGGACFEICLPFSRSRETLSA